jgi:hypothetical protein
MVRLHDAAGYDLLASVLVYDPAVRRFFGAGVPEAGIPAR